MIKKILITGGCGFVGSNLCIYLKKKGFKVTSLDNLYRKGSKLNYKRFIFDHKYKRKLYYVYYLNALFNQVVSTFDQIYNITGTCSNASGFFGNPPPEYAGSVGG